jgi:hypothetical protein
VSYISEGSTSGKGKYDPATDERIGLLHALQAAISRARLIVSTLEQINVALRHRTVTTAQAKKWLVDEGVSHLVKLSGGGQ